MLPRIAVSVVSLTVLLMVVVSCGDRQPESALHTSSMYTCWMSLM